VIARISRLSEAVAPPAGADGDVLEAGREAPDGEGMPVGHGEAGLCWLGPVLGLPFDAEAVAEPLADAKPLAVAWLLSDGEEEGVGEGTHVRHQATYASRYRERDRGPRRHQAV
jgi:hypothetical protein